MLDLSNYIIELANQNNKEITNFGLQKILYFTFIIAIQQGYELLMKNIYDEPFVVWRYGPVVNSVYKEYSTYGSLNIDEPCSKPKYNYNFLNSIIFYLLEENVFHLVYESQKQDIYKENKCKIMNGKSDVAYSFDYMVSSSQLLNLMGDV